MLVVVGMIASIRQVLKYIITKEIKCLCCVGGGGAKRCLLFIRFFGIKELEGYNGY